MANTKIIQGRSSGREEFVEAQDYAENQIDMIVDVLYEEFNDDMELFYETREDATRDVLENIWILSTVL
ncbi:MAG: hypothetical protein JW724_00715 [Candidatus Altiarchaeota archaeon]|nr:hypothetical protein [Candidatus Altiarchaeota archaeon]